MDSKQGLPFKAQRVRGGCVACGPPTPTPHPSHTLVPTHPPPPCCVQVQQLQALVQGVQTPLSELPGLANQDLLHKVCQCL